MQAVPQKIRRYNSAIAFRQDRDQEIVWEFELLFDFKDLCAKLPEPSYLENIELEVLAEEVVKLETLMNNQWKMIENYSKSEKRLHHG